MNRYLEIDENGQATHEYFALAPRAVPPGVLRIMVDVTDRPDAVLEMLYDAGTDTFSAPPAPPDYGITVDARAFQLLFTADQRKAIRAASGTDEDVADWARLAEVPAPIRLKHPLTLAGLSFLVKKGLLTEDEKTRISNGVPP